MIFDSQFVLAEKIFYIVSLFGLPEFFCHEELRAGSKVAMTMVILNRLIMYVKVSICDPDPLAFSKHWVEFRRNQVVPNNSYICVANGAKGSPLDGRLKITGNHYVGNILKSMNKLQIFRHLKFSILSLH